MMRIFISSVQKEFAEDRQALKQYIEGDALLRRFFEVFLFESLPAADRRTDESYLREVSDSDIYLGLLGDEYGHADESGRSPTEREFDCATQSGKVRLIYVKGMEDERRHPQMAALIRKAGDQLIRRRFGTRPELIGAVYASLVQFLEEKELIRTGPFDAAPCRNATIADLDEERIHWFVRLARSARGFPLPEDSAVRDVLTHLNLLDQNRPTHAAILLFGKKPQRFLISSEVKCAHFHGTEVEKPIPSYQVYKGTVFELVDQALDFVLSKIDRWVGTRAKSAQAPTVYEFPREVVSEAIVNAVAHRDYTSNASVQIMLFRDRLEVWNPGHLSPALTLEKLRGPHASIPANPLLAEPLYLAKYIERMGTGIRDMIERCRTAGLPEPEIRLDPGFFILTLRRKAAQAGIKAKAHQAHEAHAEAHEAHVVLTDIEKRIMAACLNGPKTTPDLLELVGYRSRTGNFKHSLARLQKLGYVEMTIPDKPRSSKQSYRLTANGHNALGALEP